MRSSKSESDYVLPNRAELNRMFSLARESFDREEPEIYSAMLLVAYALIERAVAQSIRACEHLRRCGLLNRYSQAGVQVCQRQALGKLNVNSSSPPSELTKRFLDELQSSEIPVKHLHQGATYTVLVEFLQEIDPELACDLKLRKGLFDGMRNQRNTVAHGKDIRAFYDPNQPGFTNDAMELANLVLAAGFLVMDFVE